MHRSPKTILLLGATGTIGQATAKALIASGYNVVSPVRLGSVTDDVPNAVACSFTEQALSALMKDHNCDAVISCVTSRSGVPDDAHAIDYGLNSAALSAACQIGVTQFVLLSAICVQKPKLAFQHAKLAFEGELQSANITWTIVRPTAYFKSLSGQLNRLRAGKPYLLFGDGKLTACKPISNDDLAAYLVQCLVAPDRHNRILPIGGPGPAITPRQQGQMLFEALGQPARFKHVPVALMSAIIAGLTCLGVFSRTFRDKAELARIGRYYATESMLVWDEVAGRYDAAATPEFGTDTLRSHYTYLVSGDVGDDRGAHAIF